MNKPPHLRAMDEFLARVFAKQQRRIAGFAARGVPSAQISCRMTESSNTCGTLTGRRPAQNGCRLTRPMKFQPAIFPATNSSSSIWFKHVAGESQTSHPGFLHRSLAFGKRCESAVSIQTGFDLFFSSAVHKSLPRHDSVPWFTHFPRQCRRTGYLRQAWLSDLLGRMGGRNPTANSAPGRLRQSAAWLRALKCP